MSDWKDLEREVEEELALAEASRPDELMTEQVTDWRFDPTEVPLYEAGLRTLLGAVEAEGEEP